MSMFGNVTTEGLEKTEDRLGGFSVLNSNAYEATIKAAFGIKSSGGALGVTLIATIDGKEFNKSVYVTDKEGKNYFHPKDKNGKKDTSKKVPLPGFTLINDLCLMTTEKGLPEQVEEEKVINVYDYDAKKEVPTSVPMLTELLGKQVYLGILKQTVNVNEKVGDEYVATEKTRDENELSKVFHYPSKLTVPEAEKGMKEAAFFDAWVEKNKDKVIDKTSKNTGSGGAPKSGKPGGAAPNAGSKPAGSLFSK